MVTYRIINEKVVNEYRSNTELMCVFVSRKSGGKTVTAIVRRLTPPPKKADSSNEQGTEPCPSEVLWI